MLLKITTKESNIAGVHSGNIRNVARLYKIITRIAGEFNWLFSEPKFIKKEGVVEWITDLEGEAIPYTQADDILKETMSSILREAIENIFYKKNMDQIELLKDALEIPTLDNILYIGGKVVLSEWGHIQNNYNAKRGLIFDLIDQTSSKLTINVLRESLPENDCKIDIIWKEHTVTTITDINGTATVFLPINIDVTIKIGDEFKKSIKLTEAEIRLNVELQVLHLPSSKMAEKVIKDVRKESQKPFILEIYDCQNDFLIVKDGEIIIQVDEQEFRLEVDKGIVKIDKWYGKKIVVDGAIQGYILKSKSNFIVKPSDTQRVCFEPMLRFEGEGAIGDPRFNISWKPSPEDIDIMVVTPCGDLIYFSEKEKICKGFKGKLDIDIREYECSKRKKDCQENITFDNGGARGEYIVIVKKYAGTSSPIDITLIIINNGQKSVEEFTLHEVNDEKVFKIIH